MPPNALAVPKTVISYAMTVMDKVEGWNEEKWVGSKLAVCMRIFTKQYDVMGADVIRLWIYSEYSASS